MSKPISWRPSEAAAKALADLIARTGKKKAHLLDDLILAASRGPEIVADNDRKPAKPAKPAMPNPGKIDHAKLAAFQEKAGMTVYDKRRR